MGLNPAQIRGNGNAHYAATSALNLPHIKVGEPYTAGKMPLSCVVLASAIHFHSYAS